MKILVEAPLTDIVARAELVIHQPADAPVLTIRMPKCPPRDLAVTAADFRPWSMVRVYGSRIGGPFVNREVHQSRDWVAAHGEIVGLDPKPFATVAWGETPADLVIIAWRTVFTALPWETTRTVSSEFDKLESVLPGFHDNCATHLRAKGDLLKRLSPMDSLAEMEKQLDLLSQLVFCQVYGEPIPEWARSFFAACFENTSTRAAGAAAAIDDIATHKAKVRAAIADYRAARARRRGA